MTLQIMILALVMTAVMSCSWPIWPWHDSTSDSGSDDPPAEVVLSLQASGTSYSMGDTLVSTSEVEIAADDAHVMAVLQAADRSDSMLAMLEGDIWIDTGIQSPTTDIEYVTTAGRFDGVLMAGGTPGCVVWKADGGDYVEQQLDKSGAAVTSVIGIGDARYFATPAGVFTNGTKMAELVYPTGGTMADYRVDARDLATDGTTLYIAAVDVGGTIESGAIAWDPGAGSWTTLMATTVTDIAWHNGALYAAAGTNLQRLDPSDPTPEPIVLPADTPPTINDLCASGDILYVGASDGLWYTTDNAQTWTHLDNSNELAAASASPVVDSIAVSGDSVFVGMNEAFGKMAAGIIELVWK